MDNKRVIKYRTIIIILVVSLLYSNYSQPKEGKEFEENALARNFHEYVINIKEYMDHLAEIKSLQNDTQPAIVICAEESMAAMIYSEELIKNMQRYNSNTYRRRSEMLNGFSSNVYTLAKDMKMLNTALSMHYDLITKEQVDVITDEIIENSSDVLNKLEELDELLQTDSKKFDDLIDEIAELNNDLEKTNNKNLLFLRRIYEDLKSL